MSIYLLKKKETEKKTKIAKLFMKAFPLSLHQI